MTVQNTVRLEPSESFSISADVFTGLGKVIVDPGATQSPSESASPIPSYDLVVETDEKNTREVEGSPVSSSSTNRKKYVTDDLDGDIIATVTNTGSVTGIVFIEAGGVNSADGAYPSGNTVPLSYNIGTATLQGDLTDSSGRVVYDIDNQTVGDGQTSADHQAVNTEDLSTKSHVAEYVLKTDGSTIDAIPQQNPEVAGMAKLTGQDDIGPLLHEIIVNQLPPQGSKKEARGLIRPRPGVYPGDLSNATGGAVVLPATVHIISDIQSNNRTGGTQPGIPTQYGGVTFETTGNAFRNPNVDSDLAPYVKLEGIRINGADATGTAFDASGSNTWDFLTLERVMTRRFQHIMVDPPSEDAPTVIRDCHFDNFTGKLELNQRMRMYGGIANPKTGAGVICTKEAKAVGAELRGDGEARPVVNLNGGNLLGCNIRKNPNGNDQSGIGIKITLNGVANNCVVEGRSNVDFANGVKFTGEGRLISHEDAGNPFRAVYYDGTDNDVMGGIRLTGSNSTLVNTGAPTRPRWNGIIGGGPLGGADLSATTGQYEGDRAMSSGATGNTGDTAYSYWTWDATNSVWADQDGNTI